MLPHSTLSHERQSAAGRTEEGPGCSAGAPGIDEALSGLLPGRDGGVEDRPFLVVGRAAVDPGALHELGVPIREDDVHAVVLMAGQTDVVPRSIRAVHPVQPEVSGPTGDPDPRISPVLDNAVV